MRYFVEVKTGLVNAYEKTTQADLIKALDKKQHIEINNPPLQNEAWDTATKSWVFDAAKAAVDAKARITNAYRAAIEVLTSGYTNEEQKTWATQLAQAKVYIANNASSVPALDALCVANGTAKATIAPIIVAKAEALELASLGLTGKYQKLSAAIDTLIPLPASTQASFDQVVW